MENLQAKANLIRNPAAVVDFKHHLKKAIKGL